MPAYRQLCDATMLPQPLLELDHMSVERRRGALRLASHDAPLTKKLDKPARPLHVLLGYALHSANAGTATAMPSEPINDGVIDLDNRDLGQRQPLRHVPSRGFIAAHRQSRMTQLR